jgi:hypothetical protein
MRSLIQCIVELTAFYRSTDTSIATSLLTFFSYAWATKSLLATGLAQGVSSRETECAPPDTQEKHMCHPPYNLLRCTEDRAQFVTRLSP